MIRCEPLLNRTGGALGPLFRAGVCVLYLLAASAATFAAEANHRGAPLPVATTVRTGFARVPSIESGIRFTNRVSPVRISQNRLLEDGAGVALGDVDGDGRCDIYFCGTESRNTLYRNLGQWRFEDITTAAGVACEGQASAGAVLADVDGDADLDLLVSALGRGVRLFRNDGRGRFQEDTASGLSTRFGARSMALADADGDGDLDLYVANYRAATVKDAPVRVSVRRVDGRWEVPPEHRARFIAETAGDGSVALLERGEPDSFYLNDGRGRFAAESWTGGRFLDAAGAPLVEAPHDWGLSVLFRDFNHDGAPDLYVCNDFFTPDRLWLNTGHGVFRAAPEFMLRSVPWASMAVDAGDLDRDGRDDLFVTEMLSRSRTRRHEQRSLVEVAPLPSWGWQPRPVQPASGVVAQAMRNTLLHQRADGTFAEIAQAAGLHASEWTWGVALLDVDLDGFEDVLIANGHHRDVANSDALAVVDRGLKSSTPEERLRWFQSFPPLHVVPLVYRNEGFGGFREVGGEWGQWESGVANGMGMGDMDGDGDMDVVMNRLGSEAMVMRNEGVGGRVSVRLVGEGGNRYGVGARVRLVGGPVEQEQEMVSGGRYLSGDESRRVFATGGREEGMRLEVRWRSGRVSVVEGVRGNWEYEVRESGARAEEWRRRVGVGGRAWFEDVSEALGDEHEENPNDEWETQPLLGRGLSRLGPGVGWMDLNGDGREELVVGSGRGGRVRVYGNLGAGKWKRVGGDWGGKLEGDGTSVVGWVVEAGSAAMLMGVSEVEGGVAEVVRRQEVFFGSSRGVKGMAGWGSGVGALALADIDGDGDLDVFVGGRMKRGQYGAMSESRVYRNQGGELELDEEWSQAVKGAGMVVGATWSDLEGDGYAELVLGCDWGPVRVYRNQRGRLTEATEEYGLAGELGWWSGVGSGDFDGDGRLDLVVGNWGRNSVYEEALEGGLRMYAGDVDGNGTWETIEGYEESGRVVPLAGRREAVRAVPGVGDRVGSYAAYAQGDVEGIFGEGVRKLRELRVNEMRSMVYLNRGGRFERRELPAAAQWAPVFGVSVGDYDGDGRDDVFLGQNFFGLSGGSGRCDAGRGLWLKGDGQGGFEAVDGDASGVKVYGEQRGTAVGDYDGDGRLDLVVTQNGGATKLYRNVRGRAGMRVRLDGGAGNGSGIGAVVRVVRGDGKRVAAREVRGGGGYWSQDSAVLVIGGERKELELEVTWPGGTTSRTRVPADTAEIKISRTAAAP